MEKIYDLILDSRKVGRAEVDKQGLYYSIYCRCTLPEDDMYRIRVRGDRTEDLGTCVPMDGAFGLRTRIPAKRLGEQPFQFEIIGKHQKEREENKESVGAVNSAKSGEDTENKESTFCPIHPDEPFAHIRLLPDAKLAEENGQMGIEIQVTEVSDQQGSDQNP